VLVMRTLEVAAIVLQVLEEYKKRRGESSIRSMKKLQKLIYFISEKARIRNELVYRFHYYGPFSKRVAQAIDILRWLGILECKKEELGIADGWIGVIEVKDEKVAKYIIKKILNNAEIYKSIKEIVEKLAQKSARELELLSSVHYLLSRGIADEKQQVIDILREIKPYFSDNEIKTAVEELRRLKLLN